MEKSKVRKTKIFFILVETLNCPKNSRSDFLITFDELSNTACRVTLASTGEFGRGLPTPPAGHGNPGAPAPGTDVNPIVWPGRVDVIHSDALIVYSVKVPPKICIVYGLRSWKI